MSAAPLQSLRLLAALPLKPCDINTAFGPDDVVKRSSELGRGGVRDSRGITRTEDTASARNIKGLVIRTNKGIREGLQESDPGQLLLPCKLFSLK